MTNEQATRALEVGPFATPTDIQRAYTRRYALFDPKTHPGNHVAAEYSEKLTRARDTLMKTFGDDNARHGCTIKEIYRISTSRSANMIESAIKDARWNKKAAKIAFGGVASLILAKIICALSLDNQHVNDALTGCSVLLGSCGMMLGGNFLLSLDTLADFINSERENFHFYRTKYNQSR